MHRIQYMLLDAGIAALMFAPLFFYLHRKHFQSKRRTLWYYLLAVYLAGVYAVVGLPDVCYMRFNIRYNFIPFAYMFSDYKNSMLNVLLFLPLGFLLPVFGKRYKSLKWTALFGFCFSLAIEILQIFTLRATDINDLMTNTAGTLLGWILGRIFIKICPNYPLDEKSRHIPITFLVSFLTMFFLHPLITKFLFFSQCCN